EYSLNVVVRQEGVHHVRAEDRNVRDQTRTLSDQGLPITEILEDRLRTRVPLVRRRQGQLESRVTTEVDGRGDALARNGDRIGKQCLSSHPLDTTPDAVLHLGEIPRQLLGCALSGGLCRIDRLAHRTLQKVSCGGDHLWLQVGRLEGLR